jgi:hypothetical protein
MPCLALIALATCCGGEAAFLSPCPPQKSRNLHLSPRFHVPASSLLRAWQLPRRRPMWLASDEGASNGSAEGGRGRQLSQGNTPKSVIIDAARKGGRAGGAGPSGLSPWAPLRARDDDADAAVGQLGQDRSEADYEMSKPGHASGKSVLALAATLVHVPASPDDQNEVGSASGAAGGAQGSEQVVVFSGGHDDEIHMWRLQVRPRLVVGDEMCAQAPELEPVGVCKLPAPVSSVFSLATIAPPLPTVNGARTDEGNKVEVGVLLVGEGRTRQVSRWSLHLQGTIPARQSEEQGPTAQGFKTVGSGAGGSRLIASPTAVETKGWGWQIDLATSAQHGGEQQNQGEGARGVQDQEDEDDEEDENGDERGDGRLVDGGSYANDPDAGRIDQDGNILMRVDESEVAKVVDTGGWRVEATRLGALPALHTGWVRGICSTDCVGALDPRDPAHRVLSSSHGIPGKEQQDLVAYSIGCNFIKVWRLPGGALGAGGTEGGAEGGGGMQEGKAKWLGDLETNADILCLTAAGGLVVSGSVDGWLWVWNVACCLSGNTKQLLSSASPASLQAHQGRVSALVLDKAGGDRGGEAGEEGGKVVVFTCGHDGFVRRWSIGHTHTCGTPGTTYKTETTTETIPANVPTLELEGELNVVEAMGLHADDDERLLCMAQSPATTGVRIPGNWASASGRCLASVLSRLLHFSPAATLTPGPSLRVFCAGAFCRTGACVPMAYQCPRLSPLYSRG